MKAEFNKDSNPTLQNLNDYIMMKKNEIAKIQTSIVECYLMEYCKVNGVKETDLSEKLNLFTTKDCFVEVVSENNVLDVKIGVKHTCKDDEEKFIIYGEYLSEVEKYPKTTKLLEKYGTGNTFSIEREQPNVEGDSSTSEKGTQSE